MKDTDLQPLSWPLERLGEGLHALAAQAGLRPADGAPLVPPAALAEGDAAGLSDWIGWAGSRLGIDIEAVNCPVPQAAALLRRAAPALLLFNHGSARRVLLLAGRRGGQLRLLAPDGRLRPCPPEALRAALCRHHEAPLEPAIERLLDAARIPAGRRATARRGLLDERLAAVPLQGCWLLRQPAGAPFWRQLVQARLPQRVGAMLMLLAAGYALEIAGWKLMGQAALDGRLDTGWLAAWALLLLTLVPLRSAGGWLSAHFAQGLARLLKQRLLVGALRIELDSVRRQGAGELLARVIESQALEAQGLGAAIGLAVSLLELGFAAWILALGAAPLWHGSMLGAWVLLAAALGWRLHARLRSWTQERLDLTHRLVEDMVGHRTRLAQERPGRRDAEQDAALHRYLQQARALDAATVPVVAGAPGGWLLLGLAGLAPALAATGADGAGTAAVAISIGGLLFAHRALGGLSGGLASLARAAIAWQQVAPLFHAGAVAPETTPFVGATVSATGPLVDASQLVYRYREGGDAVLHGADLRIDAGERILLQGDSGGGKSTLAALLVGLRQPTGGLLLLNGLDRRSLGSQWHRLATEAPQFHDNHVLTGTLAFNLLLGAGGHHDAGTVAETRALCEALGLGELLARMPGGLQQRVGETGWQLSHGEKSRLFLARALLQKAPLTVLDESFAALDPATLRLCLQTALARTRALVVIAHP